jgi:fibronectin-binding autotransporter adhesin
LFAGGARLLATAALFGGLSIPALAQTTSWNGGGTKWANGAHWTNGIPDSATAIASFDSNYGGGSDPSISAGTNITVGELLFAASLANAATIDSGSGTGTLTIDGTGAPAIGIDNLSTQTVTINPNTTLGAAQTWQGNGFTFAGTIANGGFLLTVSPNLGQTITIGNVVSGTGGLTGAGTGTLNLTSANTYSGATTISSGATLLLGDGVANNGTIASTSGIANAGTLILDEFTGVTVAKNITGAGALAQNGTVNNILSGTNTYSGATIVNGGTLTAGSISAFGGATGLSAVTVNGSGALALNTFSNTVGSIASASTTSAINLGAGAAILTAGGNNSSTTFAGVISGTGTAGLTKAGTGTLILTNADTYSGATTINSGGTLQLGSGAVNGTIASTSGIANGGTLILDEFTGVTVARNITGAGALAQNGTVNNTLSGTNTYSGATTVNGGTVTAGSTSAFGGATGLSAVTVNNGATLALGAFSNTVGSIASASATSAISLGSATLTTGGNNSSTTFAGVISGTGGLTKAGTGTLTLTKAETYSGATTINAGTLAFGAANILGAANALVVNTGATASLGNFIQGIGTISGTGAIDFGTSTTLSQLTLNANSTFSGSFAGTGTLIVGTGITLTLGATFNDSGLNIELDGGTLDLSGNNGVFGDLIVAGGSAINFNSGANSDIEFQNVSMATGGATLWVENWTFLSDYFYSVSQSQTPGVWNQPQLNQISYTGDNSFQTVYDTNQANNTGPDAGVGQIRPIIPEPGTYGAIFAGLSVAGLVVRRRRAATAGPAL